MKRKENKPHTQTARGSVLQIKTTVDFGEDGIPLERFGDHEAAERATSGRRAQG